MDTPMEKPRGSSVDQTQDPKGVQKKKLIKLIRTIKTYYLGNLTKSLNLIIYSSIYLFSTQSQLLPTASEKPFENDYHVDKVENADTQHSLLYPQFFRPNQRKIL